MMLFPVQLIDGRTETGSCSRYELEQVQNMSAMGIRPGLDQNLSAPGSGPGLPPSSLMQEGCKDGWTYSTEYYEATVVTEVQLLAATCTVCVLHDVLLQ